MRRAYLRTLIPSLATPLPYPIYPSPRYFCGATRAMLATTLPPMPGVPTDGDTPSTKLAAAKQALSDAEQVMRYWQSQIGAEKLSAPDFDASDDLKRDIDVAISSPRFIKVFANAARAKVKEMSDQLAALRDEPHVLPLGDYMKESKREFRLGYLPIDDHEVQGLGNLASDLRGLLHMPPRTMQETWSLVIKNASGVGKTFGSLAVETVLNQRDPASFYLPLYVGFGHGFGLTDAETKVLEGPGEAYERVASVVGRRLLHQLLVLEREADIPKAVKEEDRQHSWLARMPLPLPANHKGGVKSEFLPVDTIEVENLFPEASNIDDAPLISKCATLIGKLSERCNGRKLVLLLIIDEGQTLAERIKPKSAGSSGGAHSALLFTRRLQMCVAKEGLASVAPIMAGIDPVTSLGHTGDGLNKVYTGMILSQEEFMQALLAKYEKHYKRNDSIAQAQCEYLTLYYYPVLRSAMAGVSSILPTPEPAVESEMPDNTK